MARKKVEEENLPQISDVVKGYKEVELPTIGKVFLYKPNFYIMEEGDRLTAKAKGRLMRDDPEIMLEEELIENARKRGLWTTSHQETLEQFRRKLSLIVQERNAEKSSKYRMETAGRWIDPEDKDVGNLYKDAYADVQGGGTELFEEYKAKRTEKFLEYKLELSKLQNKFNHLVEGSVESLANFERQLLYCSRCYKHEDGSLVWEDLDAFKTADLDIFTKALNVALRYWAGYDEEGLEGFFEAFVEAPQQE